MTTPDTTSDSAADPATADPAAGPTAVHTSAAPPAAGVHTPAYRRLLVAWSASMIGDGVRIAALPLFAAISTLDPLAVSAVAVAEVLPWLLVALPAGALVDRWDPRRVVLVAHVVRAVLTALLALAVFTGTASVPVLVALAFALTAAETFADPAAQRLLVRLVGPDDLARGNGHYVSIETAALDIGGPLLAGALFVWTPAACFLLDAVSFVVAAACVVRLPALPPETGGTSGTGGADVPAERPALLREVTSGIRHLFASRGLRVLVTAVLFAAVAVAAANAAMALYAVEVLRIPAAAVPTLWVAMGLGTLAATRLVPPLVAKWGDGPVMVTAMAVLAGGFVLVGALPVPVVGWLGYALVGVGAGGWNVLSATRRQRLTPPALMGRITSGYRILAWGLMPLGAAAAGPIANFAGLGSVYLAAGGLLAVALLALAVPILRTGERISPPVRSAIRADRSAS